MQHLAKAVRDSNLNDALLTFDFFLIQCDQASRIHKHEKSVLHILGFNAATDSFTQYLYCADIDADVCTSHFIATKMLHAQRIVVFTKIVVQMIRFISCLQRGF